MYCSVILPLIFLIFAMSCQSTQTTRPSETLREPAGTSSDLTFPELVSILERYKFSRIQDLLRYLASPEGGKAEYLSHHTFGFHSKSLHASSPENPRAIVYGVTGEFIITFNGHKSQEAFEMLETVEFDRKTRSFQFREIKFTNDERLRGNKPPFAFSNSGAAEMPFTISPVGGPTSADFPQGKCLQCHTNSRPIWESYNQWPGFYGGDDDILFFTKHKTPEGALYPETTSPTYIQNWLKFQKEKAGTRYAYLGRTAGDPTYYNGPHFPRTQRPNGRLNHLMTLLNAQRVQALLGAYSPTALSEQDCQILLNENFDSASAKLEKEMLNHQIGLSSEVSKETKTPEAHQRFLLWQTEYFASQFKNLEAHNFRNSSLPAFAKLEKLFPQIPVRTFPTTLYEGVYSFHDGLSLDNGVPDMVSHFIGQAEKACRNN